MQIIAVTGTNGKTSTCYFLEQFCLNNNITCGRYDSTGAYTNGKKLNIPDCYYGVEGRNELICLISDGGCLNILIWETFSSGLASGYYDEWEVDIAVLTNLSKDHIELHGSYTAYCKSKFKLFNSYLTNRGTAIINDQEETMSLFDELEKSEKITKRYDSSISLFDSIREVSFSKTIFEISEKPLVLNGPRLFNEHNLALALLAFRATGYTLGNEKEFIRIPEGRLNLIEYNDRLIIIDYAHNTAAVKMVLNTLKSKNSGRIIVVTGAGGERDKQKRDVLGILLNTYADIAIVTDDNPRNEDPAAIRKAILNKCPNAHEIPNRSLAIQKALSLSHKKDIILLLGRGHETDQQYKNEIISGTDKELILNTINL